MAWREHAHINRLDVEKIYGGKPGNWTRIDKKLRSLADPHYFYEDFLGMPMACALAGGAAAGAANSDNLLIMSGGNIFEYFAKGTQTITIPVRDTLGLDIGMDQTEDDGVELTNGVSEATAKKLFTIGTDGPFFFRVKFSIENVSGTDDCAIGFRKAAADGANIDDYTDMAALNVISGNITIETILNNAATSSTDTTDDWADGETHELEVRVGSDGAVTFLIDGVAPTVTAAFTFDDTDTVVPFLFFLHASAPVAGQVILKEWEWGYLNVK